MDLPSRSAAVRLRQLAQSEGAVPIATFMAIANAHYYATRNPFGGEGDFITAPETSQMFGELIGLWAADLWNRSGRPKAALVELGPGRGTLMADARRAASRAPGMAALSVHLVETSPALRVEQRQRIPDAIWHDDVSTLPDDHALLVIANEFFDALPVRQFVRTLKGWRERVVTLDDDGRFVPTSGRRPADPLIPPRLVHSHEGAIVEASPASAAIMEALAQSIVRQGGAMLVVDYGYEGPAVGDTLQAVKGHSYADVFADIGEADLTAHVDFTALAEVARRTGARTFGPVSQAALLTGLGLSARADALKRANPDRADSIDEDVNRLTSPEEMGVLFKALAVTAPDWAIPAAFPTGGVDE